jgi:hypothetical protein
MHRFLRILCVGVAYCVVLSGPARAEVLYGVTGDGASVPETLYKLDQTNATSTPVSSLGNGNDGEVIAYNPVDGQMYHWSGTGFGAGADQVMERIDLGSLNVTNITLSGDVPTNEMWAATFDSGNGSFLAISGGGAYSITTTGVVTFLGSTTSMRGLAFVGSTLYGLEHFDTFDSDSELDLFTVDPTDGSVLTNTNVSLAGVDLNGFSNGMAFDPVSGKLFAVVQGTPGGRRLISIDPGTAVATSIGVLSDNIASIAFGPEPISLPAAGPLALLLLAAALLGAGRAGVHRARFG